MSVMIERKPMHEERIFTKTEQQIQNKRRNKKITPDKIFSICGVASLSKVYKDCGGKATILISTNFCEEPSIGFIYQRYDLMRID
jgi:hypothetical protein